MPTQALAKDFFQRHKIANFTIVSGSQQNWRCRIKLAVRQVGNKIQIGLFREGSHEIMPVYGCIDHHPRINEAADVLSSFFVNQGLTGYNETTHTGEIRYLQCVIERRTERVQATLVVNNSFGKVWKDRLQRLYKKNPSLWHSAWINVQTGKTNTIFGKEWHHVLGDKYVWESICDFEVPFLPSHFGQANLEMFERLLDDVQKVFPHGQHIAELFSGMGIISITLRSISKSITLYEIEPSAKSSFMLLQNQLAPHLQDNCRFIVGDANAAQEACESATAVIMDPPRKGVSEAILKAILQRKNIQHVLYVSCCWKTFERDAGILLEGGFSIKNARGYIFFPGTDHLETMCLFSRPS